MAETTLEDEVKTLRAEVDELRGLILPLVRQRESDDAYYQTGVEALG